MKKIRFILSILLLITYTLVATGCFSNTTRESMTNSVSDNENPGKKGSLTKYDPGITLTIAGEKGVGENGMDEAAAYLDNPWIRAYHDQLGINFEYKWIADPGQADQKLNVQIAAGEIPDIMPGLGRGQFDQLLKLGLAAPLDDVVEKYGTDLAKKALNIDGGYSLESSTGPDGKLHALPHVYSFMDNVSMMWIRKDWLENLGMEYPKTTDELYQLLKAFVHDDPDRNGKDDTLGLTTTNGLWELGSIFNAFGAQPFWSWYLENGVMKYSTVYNVEGIKKTLGFLNRLYAEELMDQEFGMVTGDRYFKMLSDGKIGIAFMYRTMPELDIKNIINKDPYADWEAYPIPTASADGSYARPFAYRGPAAYNVVSTKCKNPEAAVKMLNLYVEKAFSPNSSKYYDNYFVDKAGKDISHFALIRLSWQDNTMFRDIAQAVENKDPSGLDRFEKSKYNACIGYQNGDRTKWSDYKLYGPSNATITVIDHYLNNAKPLFTNYYGMAATQSMKQYLGSLDTMWNSVCTQIIMGNKPVSEYDSFVREWYNLGGKKIEDEINDAAKANPEFVSKE